MSLAGLTDDPSGHLSKLLRSGQPIDMQTRQVLADLLDGRANEVQLKISLTQTNKAIRAFRKVRGDLEVGRQVKALKAQKTTGEAIAEIAHINHLGEKTVERCYTLARKFEQWLKACRTSGICHSALALEAAFAYGEATRIKPAEAVKPSVDQFSRLIDLFESILVDAEGIRLPSRRSRASRNA